MYISKFSAFNFRSLKQVFVRLENGKNVIVGKNNSGKSNIVKGIEILIGEKFPTSVNFTNNDYYTYEKLDTDTGELTEDVSENIYLEVELAGRDFDEAHIRTIKKSTAFSKIKSSSELFTKQDENILVNYDFFQSLDEIENRSEVATFENSYSKEVKTSWKRPEELISFLNSLKRIKIFFCKSRLDEEKCGFGLICFDNNNEIWVSHYLTKKLRDSLITTTVVSASRSHKEDLRLVHYTWYGKLIKALWHKNRYATYTEEKTYEDVISEKAKEIKSLVDILFYNDTDEIRKLLSGAIAHKSISFRFANESNDELYKNMQLFINDGIDRPLHEKGTGIQSAIIISLFSLYCNEFHNSSSLLIAEEPELYLHPQARRVISAELDKFLKSCEDQPRQLIINTHSTEYLKNVDPFNIIRVHKDSLNNCSIVNQLSKATSDEISIDLKRFLWSNNAELFFADKVVLVEGGEVYLIPSIVDKVKNKKQLLDYKNITVSRVNGKGSFLIYVKILQCFNIPFIVLGDLDCFKDEVFKLIKHLEISDIEDDVLLIKSAISKSHIDYAKLGERIKNVDKNFDIQKMQGVFEKFANKEIQNDDLDLREILDYMKSRYTKCNTVSIITDEVGVDNFSKTLSTLIDNNIFIWSKGEIEDYYSDKVNAIPGGKDIKALQLSYLLNSDDKKIEDLMINVDEVTALVELVLR